MTGLGGKALVDTRDRVAVLLSDPPRVPAGRGQDELERLRQPGEDRASDLEVDVAHAVLVDERTTSNHLTRAAHRIDAHERGEARVDRVECGVEGLSVARGARDVRAARLQLGECGLALGTRLVRDPSQ